jgi:hypothetical protein
VSPCITDDWLSPNALLSAVCAHQPVRKALLIGCSDDATLDQSFLSLVRSCCATLSIGVAPERITQIILQRINSRVKAGRLCELKRIVTV